MKNKQIADEYYKKLMKDISDLGEYDPFCPVIKEHIHEIVKQERLKAIDEKKEIYLSFFKKFGYHNDDTDDHIDEELYKLKRQKEELENN